MGHCSPERAAMTGQLRCRTWEATRIWQEILSTGGQAPLPEAPGEGTAKKRKLPTKESVENKAPITQIKVGTSFKLRLAMEMAEQMTGDVTMRIDKGSALCMSYHPKGVCKSNYGRQHAHKRLSSRDHGLLAAWKSQFCGSLHPPDMEVDAGQFGGSTRSTKSNRYRGGGLGQGVSFKTNAYAQPIIPPKRPLTLHENKVWQIILPQARQAALDHVKVYLENFIGVIQGIPVEQQLMTRQLFHSIDTLF